MTKFDKTWRETKELAGELHDENTQLEAERILREIAEFGQEQDRSENRRRCVACGIGQGESGAILTFQPEDGNWYCEECRSETYLSQVQKYGEPGEEDVN